MDHEAALRKTADYTLGIMSEPERDRFEEHYFACPVCAEEVAVAAIFEANLRAVFRERNRGVRNREYRS